MTKHEEILAFVKELIEQQTEKKEIVLTLHGKDVSIAHCIAVFSELYDISITEAREEISSYGIWNIQKRNDWRDEFLRIVNDEPEK